MIDAYYEAALDFANELRREVGKAPLAKLPPGVPKDECECPLARALRPAAGAVENDQVLLATDDEAVWCDLPPTVADFVARVDGGYYPELIA